MSNPTNKLKRIHTDDLFSSEQQRQENTTEKIQQLPLADCHPFPSHPFKVLDNEDMEKMVESIENYGMLLPAIARPDSDGGYQIVAGHRRHHACALAGLETMPTIVRDMDDDTAAILMVDSNLQRENILPSERAFAFKIKLDAMKRQGKRTDLTSSQVGTKLNRADEIVAEQANISRNQVQRYIRLTELIPDLLDMVDERKIAFNPAVELSYLKEQEQLDLLDAMDMEQTTPSLSQAQRMKQFSQQGACGHDVICAIMSEIKKPEKVPSIFDDQDFLKELCSYFPAHTPPKVQKDTLLRLLKSSNIKTLLTPQRER